MLKVSVISPESVLYEGETDSVVAPAYDGEVGILSGHAPLMALLGEFVLTHKLEAALTGLIATLEGAGRSVTAAAVRDAREQLAQSIGKLGARGTRVGRASS